MAFVKIHKAVNLRFMHVLACKLHLNKELLAYKIAGHTQPGDSGPTNGHDLQFESTSSQTCRVGKMTLKCLI